MPARDHSGIIPGERKRRHVKLPAFFGTALLGALPQPAIGGNTASQHDFIAVVALGGGSGLLPQDLADMAAEAGGEIGWNQRLSLLLGIVRQIDDRCFDPEKEKLNSPSAWGVGSG